MTEVPEPPADPGVYEEARKLLEYIAQAAMDQQVDLPTRRLVTMGAAVWDCEEVVVSLMIASTGIPGATLPGGSAISACPVPWQVVMEAVIVRCAPVMGDDGTPPSAQQLSDAAKSASRDTSVLQAAIDSRVDERFGGVTAVISYPQPQGGFQAVTARVTAAVST